MPPILICTLPALSTDPDQLFELLADAVPRFPNQRVGAHHRMLLDLLSTLTGRPRWVERSGASSALAGWILRNFRSAKVVYLTRNMEDTAVSMSRHPIFQLTQLRFEFLARYGADPYAARPPHSGPVIDAGSLPAQMRRFLPDQLTVDSLRERGNDVNRYRMMYAYMTSQAEQALAQWPPSRVHRIRYEDLVAAPGEELIRLGDFLNFAEPARWAADVAGRIRAPSSTRTLGGRARDERR